MMGFLKGLKLTADTAYWLAVLYMYSIINVIDEKQTLKYNYLGL